MGIDPGLEGAYVILSKLGEICFHEKFPILTVGKKPKLHIMALFLTTQMNQKGYPNMVASLEKVSSAPGQGVVSMFTMGFNAGVLETILATTSVPYQYVHPKTWKASMMRDMPKEKDASVVKALQLFPKSSDILITKRGRRDHNIADALLIAEWARREFITG